MSEVGFGYNGLVKNEIYLKELLENVDKNELF